MAVLGVWDGELSSAAVDGELPVVRSAFANPDTIGTLPFAGAVAAAVVTLRTLGPRRPFLAIVPAGLCALNGLGLYLTNGRASTGAAVIAIGLYLISAADRRLLPVAAIGAAVGVPAVLLGVYVGALPVDPAGRFELWRAGIGAVRAGVLGGLAYLVLVVGPLVHGLVRPGRANVGMFALAAGFAVHQLFEGYTLYGFGPGSVIGALALGYVIASLVPERRRLTRVASEAVRSRGPSPLGSPPPIEVGTRRFRPRGHRRVTDGAYAPISADLSPMVPSYT